MAVKVGTKSSKKSGAAKKPSVDAVRQNSPQSTRGTASKSKKAAKKPTRSG